MPFLRRPQEAPPAVALTHLAELPSYAQKKIHAMLICHVVLFSVSQLKIIKYLLRAIERHLSIQLPCFTGHQRDEEACLKSLRGWGGESRLECGPSDAPSSVGICKRLMSPYNVSSIVPGTWNSSEQNRSRLAHTELTVPLGSYTLNKQLYMLR